jgi:hypothetical protein
MSGKIELAWSKDLAQALDDGRYAFYANLSRQPDKVWIECFNEVAASFRKTGPFEARVETTGKNAQAIILGQLRAFENTLSVELEAAVSQTNQAYTRCVQQQLNQKNSVESRLQEDQKIIDSLKAKFVKQ